MDLLLNTDNIRNICILAHVDHGKTTIADSLIASNGIISHKMAGKIRYLDNRQDEQERGITMKSSSIALKYNNQGGVKYLINLVDTPGHVDFCGEVSAAVRLCDGALIVVDVVEGVCAQTKVALEQAWKEGIEPILVLNKIDRLILEQQLDETAAHLRLNQLLEQVNAIVATLLNTELFKDEAISSNSRDKRKISASGCGILDKQQELLRGGTPNETSSLHVYDWASAIEDIDDDKFYFMPEKSNVVFSSSLDDWAFTIDSFANILSKKLKINLNALQKTLWGDFYIDVKQKRILKNAQAKAKRTLFASMVLESIWKIYETVCVRRDKIRMEEICQKLDIKLNPRDFNHNDARYQVKLIMSKWLQLSSNILESVTLIIPSPKNLSEKRVKRLLSSNLKQFHQLPEETQQLKESFLSCSTEANTIQIACISKMLPFEWKNIPKNRSNQVPLNKLKLQPNRLLTTSDGEFETDQQQQHSKEIRPFTNFDFDEDETVFIAFARVFSGTLRKGDKIYVLGPRHDPSLINAKLVDTIDESKHLEDLKINEHVTVATLEHFYLLRGREIEEIELAPAGNIVGIQGLDRHLIKTATISSDVYCPPFNDLHLAATPILRVAIEPEDPLDMPKLVKGLKLLNQADPCVEVKLQETGEHVIIATGEVHLQHCIKDLKERYANNIELNVSQPIVPFRETIVPQPKIDMVNETIDDNNMQISSTNKNQVSGRRGVYCAELLTPNKKCRIKIEAAPIPETILQCLLANGECLKTIAKLVSYRHHLSCGAGCSQMKNFDMKKIQNFEQNLKKSVQEYGQEYSGKKWRHKWFDENMVERIWSFGPKYSGPNILMTSPEVKFDFNLWLGLAGCSGKDGLVKTGSRESNDLRNFIDSFISGFQLATQSGPLCEEPMMGVCFTIIDWSFSETNFITSSSDNFDSASTSANSNDLNLQRDTYGPMSGQIISTVKECCKKAFQLQPQRLMTPMFSCDIQAPADALGKMYGVLGRRNGRILQGDMREGSQTFDIKAFVPVIESLDFVSEIRKQTSGMANPQLIFSHYETIDVDPFWTPTTEEEYALFGEKADVENQALKYMNLVRRRKGLSVHEKTIEHGEKQRTIKRNK